MLIFVAKWYCGFWLLVEERQIYVSWLVKVRDLKRNIQRKNIGHNDIISDLMNEMKGEKYISTAMDYSSLLFILI